MKKLWKKLWPLSFILIFVIVILIFTLNFKGKTTKIIKTVLCFKTSKYILNKTSYLRSKTYCCFRESQFPNVPPYHNFLPYWEQFSRPTCHALREEEWQFPAQIMPVVRDVVEHAGFKVTKVSVYCTIFIIQEAHKLYEPKLFKFIPFEKDKQPADPAVVAISFKLVLSKTDK